MRFLHSRQVCYLGIAVLLFCIINGCKKSFQETSPKPSLAAMSGQATATIDMQEIYAALPQTVMHNIDNFKAYVGEVQWRYTSEYLIVRIPLNHERNQSFIYAVRPYNNLTGLPRVYLVQYFPESGTIEKDFTGKQMWINFQDWQAYGVKYEHGQAFDTLIPVKIAEPTWESCAYDNGAFSLDANDKIIIEETGEEGVLARGDPNDQLQCTGGGAFWKTLGRFFKGIGNAVREVVGGVGGWLSDLGADTGGSGDRWGGGRYGGVDTGIPGDYGTGGPGGYNPGHGGGGGSAPPPPPPVVNVIDRGNSDIWATLVDNNSSPLRVNGRNIEGIGGVFIVENAALTYVRNVLWLSEAQTNWLSMHLDHASKIRAFLLTYLPDLTQQQKEDIARDHLSMMMENSDYLNRINNLTGNWWDRDQNGAIEVRKIHMELYLQANPYGMIDCNNLNQLPLALYQDVGSYEVPQSVLNRINSIRVANFPLYNNNTFRIKGINEALGGLLYGGVVNCDYFYIPIYSLPYLNGVQMTPDQLVEYFRTHINDFISPSVNVKFLPYTDHVGGTNIDETAKWNAAYENSLGSIVHIEMLQDGSVVESGYSRDFATQNHSFTVTTMYTPLDYNHPVAGNRRWGISKSGSTYYFYICGVDRTNDFATTVANTFSSAAFNGADDLWHSVQAGMLDFCDTHDGNASVSAEEVIARPKWDTVKDFLLGKKSLQQYKADLHCP